MSIRDDCGDFMAAQLGHAISVKKLDDIEARVKRNMAQLARDDPESWRQLPYWDRVQQGAAAAAKEMKGEFQRKQQNLQKQIDAHQRLESVLATAPDNKAGARLDAVSRLAAFSTRRGEYTSIESWSNSIRKETNSNLLQLWKAIPGRAFGLFEDKRGVADLWKELHGESSGNAVAKHAAEVWKTVTDELRERFNAAGGNIGKRDDWGIPHHHSQELVSAAGVDKWISDILPKLARDRYLNIDGSRMNDERMHDFLGHAYDSIITRGQNSNEPGNIGGSGMVANRNAASRVLHFKDSDSHAAYNAKYGGVSLVNTLSGHIESLSRDIALIERMGPNAARTFKFFNDRALTDELRSFPTKENFLRKEHAFNQAAFEQVSGQNKAVNVAFARRSQAVRNFLTVVKLPKVIISALGDESGMMVTSWANKVPYTGSLIRELMTLRPFDRSARNAGEASALGLEVMMHEINRFAQEEYKGSWSGKLNSTTMGMSGAERMWAARRQGIGANIQSSIGSLTRTIPSIDKLNFADHGVLARKGVTDKIWQVWRRAEVEDQGAYAHTVLTPKSVWAIPDEQLRDLGDPRALKREASTQLIAHVGEEAGMGAMDTGVRQQVRVNQGTKAGTPGGELWRSTNLFRGYDFSMMFKHWARAASMDGVGRAKYITALGVYGTLLSAASIQIRNLISGQDPDSIKDPKFWMKAALKGGGLSFIGEFLYDEMMHGGTTPVAEVLGGPVASEAKDIWDITGGAAFKAAAGKRTDEAANVIRFARGNTPVLGLWYTQAAADHLLWNHMQEAASPGYLNRMRSRAERNGKQYYWDPEEAMPSRGPDFGHALETP